MAAGAIAALDLAQAVGIVVGLLVAIIGLFAATLLGQTMFVLNENLSEVGTRMLRRPSAHSDQGKALSPNLQILGRRLARERAALETLSPRHRQRTRDG